MLFGGFSAVSRWITVCKIYQNKGLKIKSTDLKKKTHRNEIWKTKAKHLMSAIGLCTILLIKYMVNQKLKLFANQCEPMLHHFAKWCHNICILKFLKVNFQIAPVASSRFSQTRYDFKARNLLFPTIYKSWWCMNCANNMNHGNNHANLHDL